MIKISEINIDDLLQLRSDNMDVYDVEIRYRDYSSMRGSAAANIVFGKRRDGEKIIDMREEINRGHIPMDCQALRNICLQSTSGVR